MKRIRCLAIVGLLLSACQGVIPGAEPENQLLDGPVDGLSPDQSRQFLLGDAAFNKQIFTAETGLGSIFVATSCASCHAGDGKGHPFTTLTRFGQIDDTGNHFLDQGGPQLQHRALPGYQPETIPLGATSSKFLAPGNTGLGYIELVSDDDILAMADPDDVDGDGISGVPNWNSIPAYVHPTQANVTIDGKYICRFGKKGSVFNLLQQTANAYNQDIGITSTFEPRDVYSHLVTDPEVSEVTVNEVVFYLQNLKAPITRDNAQSAPGKAIFTTIGCAKCHRETLHTQLSNVASKSDKDFHPYTDLLLHDMGEALDDGYTEGSAKTYEWKTPPLWGLGLAPKSQGGEYFLLHDGRARSIDDAIQYHGGEGASSRKAYKELTALDKQALIAFLESL